VIQGGKTTGIEAVIERLVVLEVLGRMISQKELRKENQIEEEKDAQVEALIEKREDQVDLRNLVAREAEVEAAITKMTANERDQEIKIVEEMTARGTIAVIDQETEESQTQKIKRSLKLMRPKAVRSRSRRKRKNL